MFWSGGSTAALFKVSATTFDNDWLELGTVFSLETKLNITSINEPTNVLVVHVTTTNSVASCERTNYYHNNGFIQKNDKTSLEVDNIKQTSGIYKQKFNNSFFLVLK